MDTSDAVSWWSIKSEDDQIWLMMKHGFDTPFKPKRVTTEEINKLYELEQDS